jgi:hypothetical protein
VEVLEQVMAEMTEAEVVAEAQKMVRVLLIQVAVAEAGETK